MEDKPSGCSDSNEDPDRQRQPRWLQEMDVVVICDILHARKPRNSDIQNAHKRTDGYSNSAFLRFFLSLNR